MTPLSQLSAIGPLFGSLFQAGSVQRYGKDFLASVVVFLVALPLCLGIAIASGAPPALGLVSGIIGGLVVGCFSGSPLQVSGPAAGLVSVVFGIINAHGLEALGVVVFLAGLMQIAAGYFRLSPMFRAVSPAVVQGMLAAIGVLIFSSQFHVMVDDTPKANAIANILSIPQAIYKGLVPLDGSSHHLACGIGVLTIGILVLWNLLPKRYQVVPAALVAVSTAVGASAWLSLPIRYVNLPTEFLSTLHGPNLGMLSLLGNDAIWISAMTVAFVATAETMLSATAVDQLHPGKPTQFDREILAQGIGNTLAGLLGALPITGVIVRSKANIEAGASSRLSAILHGLWIGLLVLAFPVVLTKIPIASLAAVLVYTGYKLVQLNVIWRLFKVGRGELAVYAITLVAIVCTSLLEGVLLGFVLASFRLLYTLSSFQVECVEDAKAKHADVVLVGSATFVSLPTLSEKLEALPAGWTVDIRVDRLHYIDHACLELLTTWESRYQANGGTIALEWTDVHHKAKAPKTRKKKAPKAAVSVPSL